MMSPLGGALAKLLLPAKMGAGGPVGGGKQMQSWISLDDEIYAIHHDDEEDSEGVYNLTAPNPVSQKQFAKTLGKVLQDLHSRHYWLSSRYYSVKWVTGSRRQDVRPNRLLESVMNHTFTSLNPACAVA